MGTLDPAGPAPALDPPGALWRILSPIGAVLLAFALLIAGASALAPTSLSDDGLAALLSFVTSLLLLTFAVVLWRRLPAHNRRVAIGRIGSLGGSIGIGALTGLGIVIGAATIIATGSALDPAVERRLEEIDDIGTAPWQLVLTVLALVLLAPLGEELLFRGLLLRAVARRVMFWPAATISSLLFASAHIDAYLLWPRALALVCTGLALAWVYRLRGFWASVAAHATVNGIASIALVVTAL